MNSALASNPHEKHLERLGEFWEAVSSPPFGRFGIPYNPSIIAKVATPTACSLMTTFRSPAGRELWAFAKKLAMPTLWAKIDTSSEHWTTAPGVSPRAPWGTKHQTADLSAVKALLLGPNFLLKNMPHVDGSPRMCELVEHHLEDINLTGAWTGPAALTFCSYALAPLAELPVREVVSVGHIIADLTFGSGKCARSVSPMRIPCA